MAAIFLCRGTIGQLGEESRKREEGTGRRAKEGGPVQEEGRWDEGRGRREDGKEEGGDEGELEKEYREGKKKERVKGGGEEGKRERIAHLS